jgi:hypothetical protein
MVDGNGKDGPSFKQIEENIDRILQETDSWQAELRNASQKENRPRVQQLEAQGFDYLRQVGQLKVEFNGTRMLMVQDDSDCDLKKTMERIQSKLNICNGRITSALDLSSYGVISESGLIAPETKRPQNEDEMLKRKDELKRQKREQGPSGAPSRAPRFQRCEKCGYIEDHGTSVYCPSCQKGQMLELK